MLKCAIMQPTYLPWAGYFSMIANVDKFVFLDDVQFARRSWQQRNRINLNNKEKWLTVPVKKTGLRTQLISEVEIVDEEFKKSHFSLLEQAYKKSIYFEEIHNIFKKSIIDNTSPFLVDLNVAFIIEVLNYLNIKTEVLYASNLSVDGKKSMHLLNICKELKADIYVSAPGSIEYIEEEGYFSNSPTLVEKFEFIPKNYMKENNDFIPYLSIIDVIANLGREKTIEYLNIMGA